MLFVTRDSLNLKHILGIRLKIDCGIFIPSFFQLGKNNVPISYQYSILVSDLCLH